MKGAEKASMKRPQIQEQQQTQQSEKGKLNLQDITEQQINELLQQGITLDQIAQIAQEQGEPIPPLVASMMKQQGIGISNSASAPQQPQPQPQQPQQQSLKSKKYPTMMSSTEYKAYQDTVKKEEVEGHIEISGDRELALPVLNMRTVMR